MIDLKHEIKRELNQIDPPDLWARIQADAANDADADVVDLTTAAHRRRTPLWLAVAAAIALLALVGALVLLHDDKSLQTTPVTKPDHVDDLVDGGSIAFAADAGGGPALTDKVDYQRVETDPAPMDIYVTRAGEPTRRLVSTAAHERCPAFAPDGDRLAYLSVPETSRGGPDSYPTFPTPSEPFDASLVIMRLDGMAPTGEHELVVPVPLSYGYGVTRNPGYACPQWSPDGQRLAYLAQPVFSPTPSSNVADLRVVTLDGQEQVVSAGTPAAYNSSFTWSPDGETIAYVRTDGVWAAGLDGRRPSLLWHSDRTPGVVSWSSRGELAVSTSPEDPAGQELQIVDVDGGKAALVDSILQAGSPSWSPDGSRLAYGRDDHRIAVSDRDDGSTVLLPSPRVDGISLAISTMGWSADGEHLLVRAWSGSNLAVPVPTGGFELRAVALLALSTEGDVVDVLTPWSWALDWIASGDVTTYPTPSGG